MYQTLLKTPSLHQFIEQIQQEKSLLIEGLWEAPKAALLLLLAQKRNILLITSEGSENRLIEDLSFFHLNPLEFPSWETLPQDDIAPSPDIVGKRLDVLHKVVKKGPHLVIASLQACLQKVTPASELLFQEWRVGNNVTFAKIPEIMVELGYKREPIVSDKGQYALRGGILDVFPLSSPDPVRIEFFGDTIERIRTFDPIGQKSVQRIDSVFLSTAQERPGSAFVLDYLGKDALIIFDDLLKLEDKAVELQKRGLSFNAFFEAASQHSHMFWPQERAEELSHVHMEKRVGRAFYAGKAPLQPLSFQIFDHNIATKRWLHPFEEISSFFSPLENQAAATPESLLEGIRRSSYVVRVVCASESEENAYKTKFPPQAQFERGYLSSGFVLPEIQTALIPITELTHRYRPRRQKWRSTFHAPASEFHELLPGDIVVHFHHGISKYLGIEKRTNHLGVEAEFLVLEYAESGKLYVPIAQAHLVSRYIGTKEEMPTLSALGTQRWLKTRAQAEKAIAGYAQDLLRLQAERTIQGGFTFPPDGDDLRAFEQEFPFVETEDQLRAIADVKQDMSSEKAMDRLVCGDVGYGKTEVAMRAAFKAVLDGKKQVAVLVPTTVLAMQHFETFSERMANFPINVGVLSRFRTPKEIKKTLAQLEEGSLDIVIGTHRLISKDVRFKDLGLLIIDEEQRFGVRAKESLKSFKVGVDCITLSATPIPRTLYLSLIGAREISVINTPPQDRLPIKSILTGKEPGIIQNALLRELSRDGQAFFIHNRVESIFLVSEEIQKLVPEARIVVGHGQMSSEELDTVFHAFKKGEADILIATTIVENGIDIPNANTILIDRADTFGLADLYQLRGRVGRWNRPAYAYFLTPKDRSLPEITRRRLGALLESSGYGGGMKIALRDLEIRGAGDILGTQQSGQVAAIGFHLYCKLLKRTVDALHKKIPATFIETKMEFSYDAKLPESYIAETSLRLEIYHRLGDASSFEEVDNLLVELQDRFGPAPPPVIWLIHLTRIRLFAAKQGITALKFDTHTFTVEKDKQKAIFSLNSVKKPEDLEKQVYEKLSNK